MSPNLNALLWFATVIVVIPIALWLVKRSPIGAASAAGGHLRQVAVLPLSAQQRLLAVEVGSGADRTWLVLGVTPQQITTLHTMAPQADAPAATPAPHQAFAGLLQRMRQNGNNDTPS